MPDDSTLRSYFNVDIRQRRREHRGDAFADIFSKIQASNSVFASVSLPISVNTEGTYLNQVYIGMFRPDKDAFPRWYGNLKQYKLAKVGDTLRTVDAYGYTETINSSTGFIDKCARSYWTGTSTDTYWAFAYPSTDYLDTNKIDVCATIPAIGSDPAVAIGRLPAAQSNRPDGNFVEKGGEGQSFAAARHARSRPARVTARPASSISRPRRSREPPSA